MSFHSTSNTIVPRGTNINLKNFFVPARYIRSNFNAEETRACALIPAYKPGELTLRLVEDLLRWNPDIVVCVVDDCTPLECKESIRVLEKIRSISSDRVTVIRTPVNRLKAGALNYGLEHIFGAWGKRLSDVILTLDDDVVIVPATVRNLVSALMTHENCGAVCSQCHVLNKNKNLLTRLQGLEYIGFNATRLADEGFFMGPLVMHGMLTAFRAAALREVGRFAEKHLIEDYEITARLKARGWVVKSALDAHAWTIVPEDLSSLWRQRARWSYGGITVVDNVIHLRPVFQDLVGHAAFWATLCAINLLILRMLFEGGGGIPPYIPYLIIILSLLQFAIWYVFQLWLMRMYREKDAYDWLIRISIIPEFAYASSLTLVLVGSYVFLFFKTLSKGVTERSSAFARRIVQMGDSAFRTCGYTESWGTRI